MILSCALCVVVIANTMLMSVTERVSEIGTLKCLGALDRFIVRMFLVESVFIGVLASTAGALGGYLLTLLQIGASLGFDVLWGVHAVTPLVMSADVGSATGTVSVSPRARVRVAIRAGQEDRRSAGVTSRSPPAGGAALTV